MGERWHDLLFELIGTNRIGRLGSDDATKRRPVVKPTMIRDFRHNEVVKAIL